MWCMYLHHQVQEELTKQGFLSFCDGSGSCRYTANVQYYLSNKKNLLMLMINFTSVYGSEQDIMQ